MAYKQVSRVVSAVIACNGRYLVRQQRSGGCWDFPHLDVQEGESLTSAMGRLVETLGLRMPLDAVLFWSSGPQQFYGDYMDRSAFWMRLEQPIPTLVCGRDVDGLRWVLPAQLGDLTFALWPGQKDLCIWLAMEGNWLAESGQIEKVYLSRYALTEGVKAVMGYVDREHRLHRVCEPGMHVLSHTDWTRNEEEAIQWARVKRDAEIKRLGERIEHLQSLEFTVSEKTI